MTARIRRPWEMWSTLREPEADDRPHWRCDGTGMRKHPSGAYWTTCRDCKGTGVETKR